MKYPCMNVPENFSNDVSLQDSLKICKFIALITIVNFLNKKILRLEYAKI